MSDRARHGRGFRAHAVGPRACEQRTKTLFLVCSALGKEVNAIIRKHGWQADARPINALFHLYPSRIEESVARHLDETEGLYERRVVVYGHCGAHNLDAIIAAHQGVVRTAGPHCYEMYGGEDFRKAVKEEPGTYILTDYLVHVWDKMIVRGLKLDTHPKLVRLMFGHYRRMIYYSQEVDERLIEKARKIAASLDLELLVRHVGYGDLERRLVAIMEGRPQPGADAEAADYAYPVAEPSRARRAGEAVMASAESATGALTASKAATKAGPSAFVTVTFEPSGRRFEVTRGETLFAIAASAGVKVDTICGGNGSCGKCRVRFTAAPPEPTPTDYLHLSPGELGEGYRLACQTRTAADMTVEVPETGARALVRILHQGIAREVELRPNARKLFVPYSDPRSAQGVADWDRLRGLWPRRHRPTRISLPLLRALPAALRDKSGATVTVAGREVVAIEAGNTAMAQYGVAFDIGSTSIVGFLIELGTGREVAVASEANRQASHGDDIIGRLAHAQRNAEGLARLHDVVVSQLDGLLGELTGEAGIRRADVCEVTVVGNMAMHHFLLRLDSTYLGLAPYAPVLRDSLTVTATELGLGLAPGVPVLVLPNIAGFVGSDTVAVMLAADMGRGDDMRLAIDVGTNGEMVLGNRRRLISCSAPAGPAFEGARIKMGMRAVPGAMEHVRLGQDVEIEVIGGIEPKGICGSALIDLVAELLRVGLLDRGGAFVRHAALPEGVPIALRERLLEGERRKDTRFVLVRAGERGADRDIVFTQQDVREMQLAKGAIRAGAMVLMQELGLADEDLAEVMLAGAFGTFIDAGNALKVGLTPEVPPGRIRSIGNAAGVGAKLALVNVDERRRAERLAHATGHIQLSGLAGFQRAFTQAMRFPKQ